MALGFLNYEDLSGVVITNAHLALGSGYTRAALKELIGGSRTEGVLYGCEVSLATGLGLNVSAGLVRFSNGEIVQVPAQTVTLPAADAANSRIDRIGLVYSLTNGQSVTAKNDGTPRVLDKIHGAVLTAQVGSPAGTPVAPVKTSGTISLAAIRVDANQATLLSPAINTDEDTSRENSAYRFADSSSRFRFNKLKGYLEVNDGSGWYPISRQAIAPVALSLLNSQTAPAAIAGLVFDKTKVIGASMRVLISIQTDAPTELLEMGGLQLVYMPKSDTWDCRFTSDFGESGLVFSVDNTGQVFYTTTSVTGANYLGKLRITDISTLKV
jgi:hypothetical protein